MSPLRILTFILVSRRILMAETGQLDNAHESWEEHEEKIPFNSFEFWLYVMYASSGLTSHLLLRRTDVWIDRRLLVD